MNRTEMNIMTVYTTRCLLADTMKSVAKLMEDADTLDMKYDNEVRKMYEGISKAFEVQIELEKGLKR